jgi:hypothetical protein
MAKSKPDFHIYTQNEASLMMAITNSNAVKSRNKLDYKDVKSKFLMAIVVVKCL